MFWRYGHNQGIFDRVNESNNKWERYPTVMGTAHVGKNFKAATNIITNANRDGKPLDGQRLNLLV